MATRYFKTDSRRLTFRECWDLAPGIAKVVLIGAKLLRIELNLPRGVPMSDRARDDQISEDEIVPEARERVTGAVARMEALGFYGPQFMSSKQNLLQGVYAVVVSMLHRSCAMIGHIAYSRATLVHPAQEKVHYGFETMLEDGRALTTSAGPRTFQPVAGAENIYLPGRPLDEVFHRHQQRLTAPAVRDAIQRVEDVQALWKQAEESHQQTNEERLRRGVWVLLTPEEVEALRAAHPSPPPSDPQARLASGPPPLPPDPDDPVLAELEKLQKPKQRWGMALLIFGVSLVLFIVAGWLQWNWRFALMLVPILFLHELGHYIAMRCFRYQNLRMFFIPFFGAAVSGLRLQVPGWKKAVVALAGPVPGIVLGAALAFAAWRTDVEWMRKLARLFLAVNGFNLLPLMPLDGGRVFDALFFVRNRSLETIALVLAAAGMLALSFALSTKVLMFVAIAMFVGMPHLLRVARVTERVRRSGFAPDPEDAPAISREAAKSILPEVRAALPAVPPMGAKAVAQIVMNVYERLHTTPPGWPASVALLLTHGAALAVTVLALAMEPIMSGFKEGMASSRPSERVETPLVFDCAGTPQFDGNAGPFPSNRVTLIASSPDPAELREAFDAVLAADTNAALTLCGQTLFIAATNVGRAWETAGFRKLSGGQTSTLLERRAGERWRYVFTHVRGTAPDEETARLLAAEIEEYFTCGRFFRLRPPWADARGLSPEQRQRERRARHTFAELARIPSRLKDTPESKAIYIRNEKALRSGDKNAVKEASAQADAWVNRQTQEATQAFLNSGDPNIDPAVVAAHEPWMKISTWEVFSGRSPSAMGSLLGELPLADGEPAGPASELPAAGVIERKGRQFTLQRLQFTRLDRGLPALLRFLCERGCAPVHYGIDPQPQKE